MMTNESLRQLRKDFEQQLQQFEIEVKAAYAMNRITEADKVRFQSHIDIMRSITQRVRVINV